jgi:parvulin-like peptidyl-prolyl isomerase
LAREFLTKEGPALQKKLVVDEAAVKAYYDQHPDRFKQPDLVSVRHILVSVKQAEGQQGLSDADAKARIAKIQAELKKGTKFEALAKKYSDDPGSKDTGGLYADADPSGWVPEFGAAARTRPVGKVGAPVKTSYGYHLIKVESRKPAREIPFEEAKGHAEKLAQQERQGLVWNELMNDLRKEISFELIKPAPAPTTPGPAKSPEAPKAPAATKGGAE